MGIFVVSAQINSIKFLKLVNDLPYIISYLSDLSAHTHTLVWNYFHQTPNPNLINKVYLQSHVNPSLNLVIMALAPTLTSLAPSLLAYQPACYSSHFGHLCLDRRGSGRCHAMARFYKSCYKLSLTFQPVHCMHQHP
jgi:hypothetical protein